MDLTVLYGFGKGSRGCESTYAAVAMGVTLGNYMRGFSNKFSNSLFR